MSRSLSVLATILFVCLALAILGLLAWANLVFVRTQPVEKNFLVPWLGARTFLQYGTSPYSDQATQRAQIIYYGRLAAADQDPLTLWLPFPVELFYFPIGLVPDYALARAIWMTLLEIALAILGYLSLQLTGLKQGRFFLPVIILFPLLWVYGIISLVSGSAAGFIALALAGFLLALRSEVDELAGGLLILLLSAPRLCGVLVFFIFLWIMARRRWRILWGFLMGLAVLLALSFLFIPDWFLPFLRGLIQHFTYDPGLSTIRVFTSWSPVVGLRLGWVLAVGLLVVLFFEWRNVFQKDFRVLLWTACLTLSLTPLLGIPMDPKDYPFLFIPLILFLAILADRKPWLKRWGMMAILLVVFLAGPWFLTASLAKTNAYTALNTILILLLPVLLVVGLAWMRWWFVHPMPAGLKTPA
jgi:hypothetical protein